VFNSKVSRFGAGVKESGVEVGWQQGGGGGGDGILHMQLESGSVAQKRESLSSSELGSAV